MAAAARTPARRAARFPPWLPAGPAAGGTGRLVCIRRGPAQDRRRWMRAAAGVVFAIIIGAATHAGRDELTHEGRWAHTHLPWFAQTRLGYQA
ncbi:DUF4184 family protein [Brevibacterium luteolum]|uniref:DUF4184 family protein n=1 Tax=Brevibacterium luteolum TaxID=199591 RepID=UPI001C24BABC|nr:DUF4184 family protein [Brevibacterium luteolum]